MKERNLLKRSEVAAEYGISEQTLANWAWQGTGPRYIKWNQASVRYRRADIEKWLDAHTVDPEKGR